MKTDRVLRPWPPELYLFCKLTLSVSFAFCDVETITKFLVLFEIKKDVVVEMAVGELGGHHK